MAVPVPVRGFPGLFTARQDYRRVASISIISTVVATGSMLLLIPRWPQASTFLGCQALGFATSLLLTFGWSRRVIGDWMAPQAIDRGALGSLVKLGGWQLAAQGGALATQARNGAGQRRTALENLPLSQARRSKCRCEGKSTRTGRGAARVLSEFVPRR
jgi:hypothetical protein